MSTPELPRADGDLFDVSGRSAYYREVQEARSKFPFDSVRGKKNPYNGRLVRTENDYDLYIHCYALMRLYEHTASKRRTDSERELVRAYQQNSEIQRAARLYCEAARRKLLFQRFLSCILAAFSVACIFFFSSSPRPAPQPAPARPQSVSSERPPPETSTEYIANRRTKKYHRSSCSYLPDQGNRILFSTASAAEAAGYSPCKKCDP